MAGADAVFEDVDVEGTGDLVDTDADAEEALAREAAARRVRSSSASR